LDTLSSVRRPKPSGVMWKKKGSSNTVKADFEFACNNARTVFCKTYDVAVNDLFVFDDVSIKKSQVGKMSFRKKPSASLNVPSRSKLNKSLPRIVRKWLPKMKPLAEPITKWIPRVTRQIDKIAKTPNSPGPIFKWIPKIVQIYLWIIDFGCSKHMTGNRALLTNFVEKFLETVRLGKNDFAVIVGYGEVVIGSMTIKKVYYVKGLGYNLFSVGQFCDKGLEVAFRKSACFVRNEKGVDFLTGDRSLNLYTIALNEIASNSLSCLQAKASSSQSWDIGVFVGYSKDSAAFRVYNKRSHKIQESVNVNFDEISEMASKQFSLKPGLTNLNEKGKSSNPTVLHVEETSKKDLKDLFHKFYDEYFNASKLKKSPTTNVETSNNEGLVFHEVFKSFHRESSSSSLNDDVQQSPKEVILPQTNTQLISNDMIHNLDEASSSHNVFNE
nr:retrovirus-related Pol polyprotein from transposon TNT 1-94 [Tanacetum cinerariifolium]